MNIMNLNLSDELISFRKTVRDYFMSVIPNDLKKRNYYLSYPPDDNDALLWGRLLHKRGWSVPAWPVEYGGCGWSELQHYIFEDEWMACGAPVGHWGATHMIGPLIYTFGSDDQKQKFLPMIREHQCVWAQGFSEPGSGSDLASLRTSAVRGGEHYTVNGQKIWTSGAHHSKWGFFLVKTDKSCKPQQGMSLLLIEMDSPGVIVRPIRQIDGRAHVCEVFLDNVIVPRSQLIGVEGKGWSYAKHLLENERTASSFVFWNKREFSKLKELANCELLMGRPIAEKSYFSEKVSAIEAELLALEWSVLRVLAGDSSQSDQGALVSCLKVMGSQLQQRITELQTEILGKKALRSFSFDELERIIPPDSEAWPDYVTGKSTIALHCRASTIYGGSLQVQKTIIARKAFGL